MLSCKETFEELYTQSQREKTFSSVLGLIKPQPVILGQSMEWIKKKSEPILKNVKAVGYYIPFLESLKRLVCHEDFDKATKRNSDIECNMFKDINDGSFYKNHPILSDPTALAIVAYYDDIEIANPLGPKTKNHKIGVFYWFIANINPSFRSKLSIINLLAVAKTKYLRQFGVDEILKDFLDGLNILKDGYDFIHNGEVITIKGALLAFPSDTLASNYIGGFKETPSFSFSPCRLCNIKKNNMKTVFSENEITLRDPITHNEQVSVILNKDLSLPAQIYWSKMYGIMRKSVFSETPHFDLTKCFVIDIMHVLFEGVVLHQIKLLLLYCLDKKYFTSLEVINNKLKVFSFIGSPKTDCPTELDLTIIRDPKRKIKQYAAQSWQLALMLPFLIGQYVPNCDENYENFIDLLKIINICVSFEIHADDIVALQQLICIYLSTFVKLYGQNFMTPKMHYLIHLPRQILMFGPPRYLWCFRLEAKHRRLKQSALVSQNFKNVSLTVAKRLESFACLESSQANEFLIKKTSFSNCSPIKPQSLPTYVNINVVDANNILEIKSVDFENINYKVEFYLLYNIAENELPVFSSIKHIYSVNDIIYLVCELNETLRYDKKFNSFVVIGTQQFISLEISSLKYKHPVYATVFQREIHIITRHYSCIEYDYLNH